MLNKELKPMNGSNVGILPEELNVIGTFKNLKEILTDMGFIPSRVLGVWVVGNIIYPPRCSLIRDIEVCMFARGEFFIESKGRTVFTGNCKNLLTEDFIKILMGIINKSLDK